MKQVRFQHELVDSLPEPLQPNILYVTADQDVAGHLCACGCGREVITPISPTDWSLTLDRRGASLYPSIGNWSFPCRSHYFISHGAVEWASDMSDKAIAQGRRRDRGRKQRHYAHQADNRLQPIEPMSKQESTAPRPPASGTRVTITKRLWNWWKGR